MTSMSQRLKNREKQANHNAANLLSLPEHSPNPTADKLIAVLLAMETQLTDDQKQGPVFFTIKKLAPRMMKELRTVPEEKLREGMTMIAQALMAACAEDVAI